MTRMFLQNNDLSGTIPSLLGDLTKLDQLLLDGNNKLSGSMPAEICDLRGDVDDKLDQFVVDCYDSNSEKGVLCDVPSCCTMCKRIQ